MCQLNQVLQVSWGSTEINNAQFSGKIYWTMSSSNGSLDVTDLYLGDRAAPGHIHIHRNDATAATQAPSVFLLTEQPSSDGLSWKWSNISLRYTPSLITQKPFILHPMNSNLVLTLDENYKPKYVLITSPKHRLLREKSPVRGTSASQRKK